LFFIPWQAVGRVEGDKKTWRILPNTISVKVNRTLASAPDCKVALVDIVCFTDCKDGKTAVDAARKALQDMLPT